MPTCTLMAITEQFCNFIHVGFSKKICLQTQIKYLKKKTVKIMTSEKKKTLL